MTNKISNFVFLSLIILLQSCSGGRIGNFLESSFTNDNNSNKVSTNEINNKLTIDISSKDKKFLETEIKPIKTIVNDKSYSQIKVNSSSRTLSEPYRIKKPDNNYEPKTYRIFVILKKVDPSFPSENFSKVLRDGNINFEIEKIELIPELNQNKK